MVGKADELKDIAGRSNDDDFIFPSSKACHSPKVSKTVFPHGAELEVLGLGTLTSKQHGGISMQAGSM